MAAPSSARYAVLETKDLVETHRLVDQERDAEIVLAPVRGGMVTRFRIGDDNLMFLDQATLRDHTQNVRGGIPVLFPIAGRLTGDGFLLDGEWIAMPQHGFARKMPWQIAATSTDDEAAMTLSLEYSEASLAMWPFRFRLTFRYQLRDGQLTIDQRCENLGDRAMPIHPGLHPYFRVEDWRKREARVVTTATRGFDNRADAPKVIAGPIELGQGEVNLQLLDHGRATIRLDRPDGPAIGLSYDAPQTVIVLWTLPGRDFVCVEPWATQSDALNRGDAIMVVPGGAHDAVLRIARESP